MYMKTKSEMRREEKEKDLKRTTEYVSAANFEIYQSFVSSEEYIHAKSIFIYNSTEYEVDTKKIMAKAFEDKKTIALPKIIGKDIVPIKINEFSEYEKNIYGINEPIEGAIDKDIDICVIPLMAFNLKKARLGHGGGYYDRFLKDFKGIKIALAFSDQKVDFIPMNKDDVYMDMIFTEKEIIR